MLGSKNLLILVHHRVLLVVSSRTPVHAIACTATKSLGIGEYVYCAVVWLLSVIELKVHCIADIFPGESDFTTRSKLCTVNQPRLGVHYN